MFNSMVFRSHRETYRSQFYKAVAQGLIAAWLLNFVVLGHAQERAPVHIDWVAATQARTASSTTSSAEAVRASVPASAELEKVELPVLLLPQSRTRSTPRVRQQTSSYAAAYTLQGAKLSVVGSNSTLTAQPQSLGSRAGAVAAASGAFDKTEDGADLSFTRFGATYTLRISCAKVTDPRCTDESFLKSVAGELIPVGGKGQ